MLETSDEFPSSSVVVGEIVWQNNEHRCYNIRAFSGSTRIVVASCQMVPVLLPRRRSARWDSMRLCNDLRVICLLLPLNLSFCQVPTGTWNGTHNSDEVMERRAKQGEMESCTVQPTSFKRRYIYCYHEAA